MDALISIKGKVVSDSDKPDIIELVTDGRYTTKNGKRYISYKESKMTGLEGVTTTLKVEGNQSVTLMRTGSASSHLIIEKGTRQLCHYGTQYGDLMVGISGCHIDSHLTDLGGDLSFNYTLDINSNTISFNEVSISIKEAKKSNVKLS